MGKYLAEFRRASEDFKRTWDREVTLEETAAQSASPSPAYEDVSILDEGQSNRTLQPPAIEAIPADRVVPRHSLNSVESADLTASDNAVVNSVNDLSAPVDQPEASRKRDWL